MELDSKHIESELKKIAPAILSESLLNRFDSAMSSVGNEAETQEEKVIVASSDRELSNLEESLRGLVPYGVPEDMISRLDEAMSRWHEEVPVEEKVVSIIPEERVEKTSSWIGLRSVAAVGLLGAGIAFMTTADPVNPVAENHRIPVLTNGNSAPAVFTPKNARASVVRADDHGVVWTKSGQPVRCLEVHVNNEVQFVNERGEKLILEQPKREVRFTPVKFD